MTEHDPAPGQPHLGDERNLEPVVVECREDDVIRRDFDIRDPPPHGPSSG
jgi:hypothetical protein